MLRVVDHAARVSIYYGSSGIGNFNQGAPVFIVLWQKYGFRIIGSNLL